MARPTKIWQRKSDGWWYVTHAGSKIRLSKDRKEAEKAFHTLLAHDTKPEDSSRLRPPFRDIADAFLSHSKEANAATTFDSHKHYLQSFCDHVKNRRAPDLRGEHVTSWLKANPQWGQSTRSLATQAVKAALNWARGEGKISVHPLEKVKQGQIKRRERILTPEEREKIRKRASGTFKDFLFALEQTGCRPFSEVGRLEAKMVNWAEGTAELPEHKNARHGKRRILYFTPEMMEVLKRLAAKHPTGLLFRNRFGSPWGKSDFFKWCLIFRDELGIEGIHSYVFRHAYATDAITRGVPLPMLAELMGTSVKMLLLHYGHVGQKKDALRAAAARALNG